MCHRAEECATGQKGATGVGARRADALVGEEPSRQLIFNHPPRCHPPAVALPFF